VVDKSWIPPLRDQFEERLLSVFGTKQFRLGLDRDWSWREHGRYKVLDTNHQPINIAGMTVQEFVSASTGTCTGAINDSSTWTTDQTGGLPGGDRVWLCPIQQNTTCGRSYNQTFTANGYGLLVVDQTGTYTGTHNAITWVVSNGIVSCPRIVITP
jgi:hypothetical protein